MKRLILLRHAKAEAKDAARDIERVLAPRGRADMIAVAAYLTAEGLVPDLALVSSAARTRETWALAGLGAVPARPEPRIYEASPETLLAVIRVVDDDVGCLMLVGHNPGLEELTSILVEGRASWTSAVTIPTGTIAVIDASVERWAELGPHSGRLERLVTPADLGAGKGASKSPKA